MLRFPALMNLQSRLLIWMALTLKAGELVLEFWQFLDSLLDAWIAEFIVQCATPRFGASERHCNCYHLHKHASVKTVMVSPQMWLITTQGSLHQKGALIRVVICLEISYLTLPLFPVIQFHITCSTHYGISSRTGWGEACEWGKHHHHTVEWLHCYKCYTSTLQIEAHCYFVNQNS